MAVRTLSWNVRGLNSPHKRQRVWKYLIDHKIHVAALQETHLPKADTHRLKHKAFPLIYTSSHTAKHNGVALLFHKDVPFQMQATKADKSGRYILARGDLRGRPCTFAAIYAPNQGQQDFLLSFLLTLETFATGDIILLGDFNLVGDPTLDTSNPTRVPAGTMGQALKAQFDRLGLLDIWRVNNPTVRDYTFFSHSHKTYSRIDHIFMSQTLRSAVLHTHIHPICLSDHAPLELTLTWPHPRSETSRWYFPDFFFFMPR